MSEMTPPQGSKGENGFIKGRSRRLWARSILFLCLAAVMVYVGVAAQQTMQSKEIVRQSQAGTMASAGLSIHGPKTLASKFTDKQGRLLADPPESPDQFINPDTIVVAHIDGSDETPGTSWADWEEHLSKAIGKKVVDQTYTNSADQISDAGSGKVTLLALHAADAPFLVNNFGFQPLAVLGDRSGINGKRLSLVVPAGSPIATPSDIRNHKLACTVPSSITGYRAAIAYLMHDQGLRPNIDYEIIWTTGQKHSVTGIADKKYEVAAVSDEKLESMEGKNNIDPSQYKVIYQSQVIPRTTIGYFYNLNPALAEKIRQAILTPGPTTGPSSPSDQLAFMPVDYKRDFQFVREIDDEFDPRFDANVGKVASKD